MLPNSLPRIASSVSRALQDQVLPALSDANVRACIASAVVLLDLIAREAQWKLEHAARDEACRSIAIRKLPGLLGGTPLASWAAEIPQRGKLHSPTEAFMAGWGEAAAKDSEEVTGKADDYVDRLDRFVMRLTGALVDESKDPALQQTALRRWITEYCLATVAATKQESVSATVGNVTRG